MRGTVAITGGAGFIGKYVQHALELKDYVPVIVDRSHGVDVLSDELEHVLKEVDGVIHLAGILGTDELFDEVDEAIDVNVKGTAHVLRACKDYGLSYVGITMPQVWDNIYQATKLAAVKMANAYHRHYDVPVCHVRAFNVYGEGQKVGKPQKIVPTFSSLAWQGASIPIWGDGLQLVDMIHARDVAHLLVQALDFGDGRILDAGTGLPMTVNDVADIVTEFADSSSPIKHLPMRRGEHGHGAVATGEGWSDVVKRPWFNLPDLKSVVESYRPQ